VLTVFCLTPAGLKLLERETEAPLPEDALWLDLLEPTQQEERLVEARLGIDIPTREEMSEIESSSRLYEEEGGLYVTVTVVTKLDSDLPENAQVTFILKDNRLVTNRYIDTLPFRRFQLQVGRHPQYQASAQAVFVALLEYIVNRIADVIERVGADIDRVAAEVFNQNNVKQAQLRTLQRDYRKLLERTGQAGELIAKARESLASLSRLLAFVQQSSVPMAQDVRTRLRTLSKDVVAMSDHANFLNSNLNFVLDATLGMINIDQNNILKIFSVVTVFLLPPSVIGGIFGMNFAVIPTTQQPWGFAAALGMMLLSALLPWMYFKHRGWL
jgi:magnesium transporter